MARLATTALIGLVLLAGASSAQARTHAFFGGVKLGLRGWGSVQPGRGFDVHTAISCTPSSCEGSTARARVSHITLIARPHQGWKLLRWSGACTGKKPKCVLDLSHRRAGAFGDRIRLVHARFSPAAPGGTRANPLPLGHAGSIYGVWKLRFNSATANVQLSPPAPVGAEYLAASLTATYLEPGIGQLNGLASEAIGSHNVLYGRPNPNGPGCPGAAPPPVLWTMTPYGEIAGGESVTGNVCWLIRTDDEGRLEVPIRLGGPAFFVTEWFALH